MLEGSRVIILRLADCSNARTVNGFPESDLAESGCAVAAVEKANSPVAIAAKRMRQRIGFSRTSFMGAILERIRSGFKAAQFKLPFSRKMYCFDPKTDKVRRCQFRDETFSGMRLCVCSEPHPLHALWRKP